MLHYFSVMFAIVVQPVA